MYQQINLYQPVFRRQRKVFSAATLLQVLLIAAIVLLGMYLHARWTTGRLQTTVDNLSGQYQQLEAQLGSLENPQVQAAETCWTRSGACSKGLTSGAHCSTHWHA